MRTLTSRLILCSLLAAPLCAHAVEPDYTAIKNEGYGDVADLLKSLTPEQRAQVMKQAQTRQQDLQKMSPDEVEALKDKLKQDADTIDVGKVDPKKVHTDKIKTTGETMKDLETYQQKYQDGQIHNAVVRPNLAEQAPPAEQPAPTTAPED